MGDVSKLFLGALVAATFTAGSALAFQGFSVGVIANDATFDTVGTEFESGDTGNAETNSASVSEDADFPSFFVEYTGGTAGGMSMTFGIEHIPDDATLGAKTRTDDNAVDDDDGDYTAKAEISDYTALYIEPGYMFNDFLGFYAKAGITHVTLRSLESIDQGDDSSTYGNEDVFGGMYGAGIKASTAFGLFIKAEYLKTRYEGVRLESSSGNGNIIEARPEQEAVRFALGFNF